ncbi:hypothetical protein METBIDRAFT_12254 [Metschnikowia bicuspidata var. bicuspidata NRRL YB-4993]|uniref:Uncharacterized protein n=1 Tax=Metschnikowia bicuspidata var. bicuspidata NRRL YB-4993 TaxID=869754 RepID=A0A1A0H7Y0_9ASCO|nr:hypothetical protein METBIDRAFT_12254 [Metschnikowia bicuspidata var. bicuspidata NRRL YB-4993]OBA20204.1 hypothetical protein METBIDRAFT_12254 [Metschnikowia bicuspidata var. bicuspidata NRRL YB-4993]
MYTHNQARASRAGALPPRPASPLSNNAVRFAVHNTQDPPKRAARVPGGEDPSPRPKGRRQPGGRCGHVTLLHSRAGAVPAEKSVPGLLRFFPSTGTCATPNGTSTPRKQQQANPCTSPTPRSEPLMKPQHTASSAATEPVNVKDPIRLAFLGGPRTGKTATILKLSCGTYRDTYYPLRKTTPVLFTYQAQSAALRLILDQHSSRRFLEHALARGDLLLSPVVSDALVRAAVKKTPLPGPAGDAPHGSQNEVYAAVWGDGDSDVARISPILAELIDTPAFNSSQFIPFLEASLHARLGKNVLRKLADTPRQPVNTEPLLVASGAGEMNGAIDGYFLFYSAVPSAEPPQYDELVAGQQAPGLGSSAAGSAQDTTLSLLPVIKAGLEEAWREYHTYRTRWDQEKEKDMFSLKTALRTMFDAHGSLQPGLLHHKLLATSLDPADPLCPPPIWIVCTHKNLPLASPTLIHDGKKLALLWRCGFYAMDVTENLDQVLALVIREVVERKSLQRARRKR